MNMIVQKIQYGLQKVCTFVKDNSRKVMVGLGLGIAGAASTPAVHAQSSVTALPFDPSFLYNSITTPTNAALVVALGFAALFIVIRMIRKAINKS